MAKKLSVDVVEQAELGKEVPPESDVIKAVFENLCQAAEALHARGDRRGALIVIGKYASAGEVPMARGDLRPNPFKGQYVSVGDKYFQRMILQGAVGEGAVVADESGQILGGGIMLAIDNYAVDVPAGGFMRHTAAAATSLRKEVMAVITLSEENNIARVFQMGEVTSAYDPAATEQEAEQKEALEKEKEAQGKAIEQKSPEQLAGEATQVVPPPGRRKAKRATTRKRKRKSDRSTRSTQTGTKASDVLKDKKKEKSDVVAESAATSDDGPPADEDAPGSEEQPA